MPRKMILIKYKYIKCVLTLPLIQTHKIYIVKKNPILYPSLKIYDMSPHCPPN